MVGFGCCGRDVWRLIWLMIQTKVLHVRLVWILIKNFSAINGSNDGMEKRRLWDHLMSFHSSIYEELWILARGFNIIMQPDESFPVVSSEIKEFSDALVQLLMFDHAYTGLLYTWSNH